MRCGVSDKKRDAATGQKNPAFGQVRTGGARAAHRLRRELLGGACPPSGTRGSHIAPRAAPDRPIARMSRSGPSNDPVRSEDALVSP